MPTTSNGAKDACFSASDRFDTLRAAGELAPAFLAVSTLRINLSPRGSWSRLCDGHPERLFTHRRTTIAAAGVVPLL